MKLTFKYQLFKIIDWINNIMLRNEVSQLAELIFDGEEQNCVLDRYERNQTRINLGIT